MTKKNLVLKTALGSYGNTRALKDGTITVPGIDFEFAEITPVYKAFRPMIEQREFDVSEMAVTTFMLAKAFDKQFTALPLFVFRKFHHRTMLCNVASGIREPRDIEGKRVGIRAYAQTGPTWSRGILQHEYGVDLDRVEWVTFEGSHVVEYQDPEGVTRAPEDKQMADMLKAGEIDAAILTNPIESPSVRPLIAEGTTVEAEWFRRTGVYPVNHLVVVKSEIANSEPWIPKNLLEGFEAAKRLYVDRLTSEGPATAEDRAVLATREVVGDPFPYGIIPNRKSIETLAQFAFEQKILPKQYGIEELFEPSIVALG